MSRPPRPAGVPVLTIAIPTHNRAALLDRQLAWLAEAVVGLETAVELVVSDNASTDGTPRVLERWQRVLGPDVLHVRRQPEDVGAIRNIASCLVQARGAHVWVVSDDDVLSPGAVRVVVDRLSRDPELALLTLNFSSRFVGTGELRFERCYEVGEERVRPDGAQVFSALFAADVGGVALTTAQVYRTDLVREAVERWGSRWDNLMVQVFWTGYCAAGGPVLVTRETHLECAAGRHFFLDDPLAHLRIGFVDLPEVVDRLVRIGYPERVLRPVLLQHLGPHALPLVARAARVDPRGSARALRAYARAVRAVGLEATLRHVRDKAWARFRDGHVLGRRRRGGTTGRSNPIPARGRDQAVNRAPAPRVSTRTQ